MKHRKLIVTIVVCIIVFVACLSSGIILAVNSLDWASIGSPGQFRDEIREFYENGGLGKLFGGHPVSMTLNETFDLDLQGINTIEISGVSETITVDTNTSDQVSCSLTGDYFTLFNPIEYKWEKVGDRLLIYSKYPIFGFASGELFQKITIPADFSGNIQIADVSGNCTVTGKAGSSWAKLTCSNVSGGLDIFAANLTEIKFNTVSGTTNVRDCKGSVNGESVSGNISVTWNEFNGGRLSSISGGINVVMPQTAKCKFTFDTVSGGFNNIGLPVEISGQDRTETTGTINGGDISLKIDTVSGGLQMSAP